MSARQQHPASSLSFRDRSSHREAALLSAEPRFQFDGNGAAAPHQSSTLSNRPLPTSPMQASPKHGRSLSHPFPSLFGSGKKDAKKTKIEQVSQNDDSETQNPRPDNSTQGTRSSSKASGNTRCMVTGRCLICGSTVRWPQDLDVYRCTVCLTVNDLSITTPSRRKAEASEILASNSGSFDLESTYLELSLEEAQDLALSCLRSYLKRRKARKATSEGSNMVKNSSLPSSCISVDINAPRPKAGAGPQIYLSRPPEDPIALGSPEKASTMAKFQYSQSSPSKVVSPIEEARLGLSKLGVRDPPKRKPPSPPIMLAASLRGSDTSKQQANNSGPATNQSRENLSAARDAYPAEFEASALSKFLFKPLEDYIVFCFTNIECLNIAFTSSLRANGQIGVANGSLGVPKAPLNKQSTSSQSLPEIDAKVLLAGDFAENGSWWAGQRDQLKSSIFDKNLTSKQMEKMNDFVSVKTPRIDWGKLSEFYRLINNAGEGWRAVWDQLRDLDEGLHHNANQDEDQDLFQIAQEIRDASVHLQRVLLKASENLLKRPGRPLKHPADVRFCFILLANPILYYTNFDEKPSQPDYNTTKAPQQKQEAPRKASSDSRNKSVFGRHSGIVKRILGILSNLPNDCHRYLVSWFSRFSEKQFRKLVELVSSFVSYRLTRQQGHTTGTNIDPTAGLVPRIGGMNNASSAQLHAAIRQSDSISTVHADSGFASYTDDWQIKAAARVMSLLFSANDDVMQTSRTSIARTSSTETQEASNRGRKLSISNFYNSMLDRIDLLGDFEAWESRKGKFAFCQYPFLLSIWAKIRILEYDARRQMEVRAKEAFFNSIMRKQAVSQYLVLRVRRECLVDDSLRAVSEVVGTGQEDIKKGLRIDFVDEEGIDAGGLRKEWFLLLTRDIFNPLHGLFVYDEDSRYCYFNPYCFETSDQFFLVGVLLGLAIYNSTILDIALPPFAFRKLLESAPGSQSAVVSSRLQSRYTLDDLAELRPALATGLRQLLEFEGNVEETFCRDFVVDVEKYGQIVQIPLCPDGEARKVNNENRKEFVDLYIHYLLEIAVARQFEPFKRGFFTVCGGNALSLFKYQEIELLICGSDEPLEVSSLQAVALYDHWPSKNPAQSEAVVAWFWQFLERASPINQRKILSFITGSDRIPAMGAMNLVIKILCLGDDTERFPVARTCFNSLYLYRYCTKEKLESKLWRAVLESEGFGLK